MRILYRAAQIVLLPAVLLALWWFSSASSTDFYFPPLETIFASFGPTWFGDRMMLDVLPSLGRLAVGYLLALVLGVALGLWLGVSQVMRQYTEPLLEFFRAIPAPAIVPVLIIIAGIGDEMKVLVIVFGCVWPILLNTIEGVRGLEPLLKDTSLVYGLGPMTRLRHLLVAGASPRIFTGARQALSVGIIVMVISEMFAASSGLGFSILYFQRTYAIPEMWTGILLLGIIGVLLSLLFRGIEALALRWYDGYRAAERGA